MKILIDIDDEDYKRIQDTSDIFNSLTSRTYSAIRNGTPLPKGHGDLKDTTDLLKMTKSYKSELGRLKADPFVKSGIETVENFIRNSPTIIEADKEREKEVCKDCYYNDGEVHIECAMCSKAESEE